MLSILSTLSTAATTEPIRLTPTSRLVS